MAAELLSKGNNEFVNENYPKAVELYTEAIDIDSECDEAYCHRAQVHIKTGKFADALKDSESAIKINSKNSKAYLRKGTALFHLEKYSEAKEAFSEGDAINPEDNFKTWIRKCEAEIDLMKQEAKNKTASEPQIGMSGDDRSSTVKNTAEPVISSSKTVKDAAEPVTSTSEQNTQRAEPVPLPTGPKTKYDWYQTETHIVVTIMLKKVNKEDCTVNIQEESLSATVKLPTGTDYCLELDLAHKIIPDKSTTKVLTSKIEIKLKKVEGIRWGSLEDDGSKKPDVKQFTTAESTTDNLHKYPSSSHYTRNWDEVVTQITEEEKNEKPEGDAALNQLFQQIYGDGTDETKKAMMKSFYESGGTVLSTNWKEVGEKKVDVKPPDGMEYKKWNQ